MYMSYCRFEGTYMELSACLNALRDEEELSDNEKRYACKLKDLCEAYIEAVEDGIQE